MRKRRLIALPLCGVVVAGAIVFLVPRQREPVLQGKPLSAWLAGLRTPRKQAAAQAIRQMGSEAVPFLIRELQATDSPLKLTFVRLAQKQRWYRFVFLDGNERHERARAALRELGPLAEPAIPILIERFKGGNIGYNLCGPYEPFPAIGSNSVEPLLKAMNHDNKWVRFLAVRALKNFPDQAASITPALVKALHDADPGVRYGGASSLGAIKTRPELAVPALTQALAEDKEIGVREIVAETLGGYGKIASSSAPTLLSCIGSTNKTLRGLAAWALVQVDLQTAKQSPLLVPALIENLQHETWWLPKFCAEALKQIDPEAAAKAGVK